jgi:hypothetical protein
MSVFDDPAMRPRYQNMTDPHEGNEGDGPLGIRVISYLGDYDDYFDVEIIAPYASRAERDAEVRRLGSLPGMYGLLEFVPCSLSLRQIERTQFQAEPGDVANAIDFKSFMAGFRHDDAYLLDDDDEPAADPYEPHPDQISLFDPSTSRAELEDLGGLLAALSRLE